MTNAQDRTALIICGPTASGKTEIAELVAKKLDTAIISADSRQIYKHLNIGTAKPLDSTIQHHMIDIIEPDERFNAMQFVQLAINWMDKIAQSGKIPIIVGGTGLYIRALTQGIFPGEFKDDNVRKELKLKKKQGENLYTMLKDVDPIAAGKINPKNYVRIERALEVYIVSGKPISYWWEYQTKPPSDWNFKKFAIQMDKKTLYKRIEDRTEKMLQQGWIEEVRDLLGKGISPDCPGLTSIGYGQIVRYIRGEIDYEQMFNDIVRDTKRYAKRQITWFRKEPDVHWVEVGKSSPEQIADKIINLFFE
ncbi:tRNA (adenosine(37)-N6)-dimethylallyltransferase MiaA [bacterium]|mgnify:CR=1 FL=1|nr:MAG: tRNA (adenosine(37)-N6)-dimethylallyltransferase MiaA [bacterium]